MAVLLCRFPLAKRWAKALRLKQAAKAEATLQDSLPALAALEQARTEVEHSYERLAFAHYAATVMTSLAQDDGLAVVLRQACERFESDAAAVVAFGARFNSTAIGSARRPFRGIEGHQDRFPRGTAAVCEQ